MITEARLRRIIREELLQETVAKRELLDIVAFMHKKAIGRLSDQVANRLRDSDTSDSIWIKFDRIDTHVSKKELKARVGDELYQVDSIIELNSLVNATAQAIWAERIQKAGL